eukprot:135382-Hanusia_phi.AAC.1
MTGRISNVQEKLRGNRKGEEIEADLLQEFPIPEPKEGEARLRILQVMKCRISVGMSPTMTRDDRREFVTLTLS